MNIQNDAAQSNKLSNQNTSFDNSYEFKQSVQEVSEKELKCFADYFDHFDDESDILDLRIKNLNVCDDINQANVYWKPQRKQPKFLHDYYLLGDTIGRGSYGKVKDCIDIRTLKRYAIKIVCRMKIKKIPSGLKHVESEIALMKKLYHKNIVTLIDEFHEIDPDRRCIVLEFCLGSIHDLQTNGILESSNQFRYLPEWQAHYYYMQIIDGVEYLHSQRLVHKDLKPGNFLLTEHEVLKITDFGVSEQFDIFQSNSFITGGQTTPAIQPPELAGGASNVCGYKLDIYGTGVSLYFMLCGKLPFNNPNVLLIFDEIASGEYSISEWVSSSASSLICGLMNKNVEERLDLNQVRQHEWFSETPEVGSGKIEPREYLMYSVRDPSKECLYQLSSALKDTNRENADNSSFPDDTFPDSDLSPVMPLTVTSRLRTYYDWPLTEAEERVLRDEQFIITDDYIRYDEDDVGLLQHFSPINMENTGALVLENIGSQATDTQLGEMNASTSQVPHGIRFYINSEETNESNLQSFPERHDIFFSEGTTTSSKSDEKCPVAMSASFSVPLTREGDIENSSDTMDDRFSQITDPYCNAKMVSKSVLRSIQKSTSAPKNSFKYKPKGKKLFSCHQS